MSVNYSKDDYYKKEYERIVNRFIWNASIFSPADSSYDCCYREAVEEIEKLYQRAKKRRDMTSYLRIWALQAVKRHYTYNKRLLNKIVVR